MAIKHIVTFVLAVLSFLWLAESDVSRVRVVGVER